MSIDYSSPYFSKGDRVEITQGGRLLGEKGCVENRNIGIRRVDDTYSIIMDSGLSAVVRGNHLQREYIRHDS